ncbi:MAG: phosphate ABC transporter substrate-binding protein [candidate division WOR-3 bacterium]
MHRYLLLLTLILFTFCSKRTGDLVIAGSTSVQPFIEKLAEEYMIKNKNIKINVQGGGSTAGIQAVFNKTCAIGTSSRNLHTEEQGLHSFIMAIDGIAIVVHPSNPIKNLTHDELKDIFAGKITNWKEVGGPDKKIYAVTREEGSGTRGAFEELIMHGTAISDACLVQDSNGAIREIVANTPQAIGYISAGLVDNRVKALSIDSVAPTLENYKNSSYKFLRPFLLLTLEEPKGTIKSFIDYVLSDEAQEILMHEGLIPANIFQK